MILYLKDSKTYVQYPKIWLAQLRVWSSMFITYCLFQVTKMLVTLVVVFALCWLPLHLFTLILDLAPHLLDKIKTQGDERLFLGIYYFCHWLAMANSFANPIIYCFLNDSFRVGVQEKQLIQVLFWFINHNKRQRNSFQKMFAIRRQTRCLLSVQQLRLKLRHDSIRYFDNLNF